jgi:hypothetical protein
MTAPGAVTRPVPLFRSIQLDMMNIPTCPHCGEQLKPFELPDNTGWEGGFQLACFNDECPYFVRGWQHMEEHYAVKASYRYRVDPSSGKASPLAVWSATALTDRILDDLTDQPANDGAGPQGPDQGSSG